MSLLGYTNRTLKNLFSKPVTELYPFVSKENPAGARGKLDIEIEKCIFCGICQRKCPTAAITVTKDPKTWAIDRLRCVSCNACVEVCPKKCLALDTKYSPVCTGAQKDVFAAVVPPAEKS